MCGFTQQTYCDWPSARILMREGKLAEARDALLKLPCQLLRLCSPAKDPLLASLRNAPEFPQVLSAAKQCQNKFLAERNQAGH
jgi:hypothetical protein